MERQVDRIRERFIPIIELGPRLTTDFEHLRRAFQDGVAAQDNQAVEQTHLVEEKLLDEVEATVPIIGRAQASALRSAIGDYYAAAQGVSVRILAGETGLTLVDSMSAMQAKQLAVEKILTGSLTLDRQKMEDAFSVIERTQRTSGSSLALISVFGLLVATILSLMMSRSILNSINVLSLGLKRFGRGDFSQSISLGSRDELSDLATDANQMAVRTRALMRELESFSYSVAHDLRAPLRSMLGFGNVLLEDYGSLLPQEGKDTVKRVISSAKRMGQLIDSLLSLSRLARAEIKRDSVDLSRMARDLLKDLQESQPERRVEVIIQDGATVLGDSALLRVVLTNLFSNAWKFTSKTAAAKIEFGFEEGADAVSYFVRDNGAGFDMQYVDKLFGTFQRLHSNEDFEGTGIGLATVRTIIGRHGGDISAYGEVGKGAAFRFTLWNRARLAPDPRKTMEGTDVGKSNIASRG